MIKKLFFTGLCAAGLYLLAACVKNDPAPVKNTTVNVDVINATDNILNFYVDGTRQSILTGINPLASNGYTAIPYGTHAFSFKKQFDKDNFSNVDTLFTLPVKLDSGSTTDRYSIFVGGLIRSQAFMVKDAIAADSKNAKVRFVTASPDMPAFRVYFNDTLVYTSSAFKSVQDYTTATASLKKVNIRPVNANNILYTTNITVSAGRSYTLFTQGANSTFRAGLITNQ
jgi:hypothetical protein